MRRVCAVARGWKGKYGAKSNGEKRGTTKNKNLSTGPEEALTGPQTERRGGETWNRRGS